MVYAACLHLVRFLEGAIGRIDNAQFKDASIDTVSKVEKVYRTQRRFLELYPKLTNFTPPTAQQVAPRYPQHNEIDELVDNLSSIDNWLLDMEPRSSGTLTPAVAVCGGQREEEIDETALIYLAEIFDNVDE
ncbi:uncharacterized protein BKA55DRAFT_544277 [Fusarium redolens]|uniref:Uncharacterized protein n=1 Tax=Fusarium redolens TaxID=48865 RepID=A0A9P9G663_FUSRE|nr:uncharacterized protein BKA55DRAFT_544277 [Fusarium redolens]KAH7233779.1 hypothetical protein BKA55DRAFT_544277 [Fusarium redolens]